MWYLAHSRQYCMWLVLWPLALTRTCYSSDTTNTNNKNDWYSDAAGPHLVRTSVLDFPLAPPVQGSHAVWYPIGLDTPLPVYFYMSGTNMKPSSYHQTLELVASYGIAVVGVANTFKFGGLTTCGYLTGVSSFSNSVTLMIESLKNGTLQLPGAITTDASKIAVGGHSGGGACALWAASDLGKDIAGLVSEHAGQIHGGNMVSAAGMRQISAASLVMCGAYDTMPACGCPVAKGVIFDRLQAPKYFVNDTIPCPTATDNLRAHKLCHVGFAGQPQLRYKIPAGRPEQVALSLTSWRRCCSVPWVALTCPLPTTRVRTISPSVTFNSPNSCLTCLCLQVSNSHPGPQAALCS